MAGDKMQRSLEVQRDETVNRIEFERRNRKLEIRKVKREKLNEGGNAFDSRIGELKSRMMDVEGKIGSLNATLASIPPDHPERNKIMAAIANMRKFRENLKIQIGMMAARKNSQLRMIEFQFTMQEKNLDITMAAQKKNILTTIAERIMALQEHQAKAMQMQKMKQGQGTALSAEARKEAGSAAG